jgi:hypothetical protein
MAEITKIQNGYVIDYPFSFTSQGKVGVVKDTDPKVIRNKVLSLVSIGTLERVWYSDYGINLNSILFENSNLAVEEAVRGVTELFVSWLPELTLEDIKVDSDETNGYLVLSVIYTLPSGKQDSVRISTSSLSAAGEKIEGL